MQSPAHCLFMDERITALSPCGQVIKLCKSRLRGLALAARSGRFTGRRGPASVKDFS